MPRSRSQFATLHRHLQPARDIARVNVPSIARMLHLSIFAIFLLAATLPGPSASAQEASRSGAGLVVRHGDGTLVYAYVEFDEETISGEELLLRSGLDLTVTPYGGLGLGVCAINGEGCPADNCYCESYGSPAYYWVYFTRSADGWLENPRGPTSRQLRDGDIDGWSWTAGDHGLPDVTIDEIAALTGFHRGPEPTATQAPTATSAPPTATPTAAALPSQPLRPSTPVPPTPAREATATPTDALSTATATPTAPPVSTPSSTPAPPPMTPTQRPRTSTPEPVPSEAAPTNTPTAPATAEQSSTATAASGAVVVRPGATPEALESDASNGGADTGTLLLFGGFVTVVGAAGTLAVLRRRRSGR